VYLKGIYTAHICSRINNNQKVEPTQVFVDRDKQNVVHTYNGIPLSLKKEENSGTFYNIDEL
jgi:hypothetical protein